MEIGAKNSAFANVSLSLSLWLVLAFPLFPSFMEGSHLHINFLLLVLGCIYITIFSSRPMSNNCLMVLIYLLVLQVSIIVGSILSEKPISLVELPSIMRPVIIAVIFIGVFLFVSSSQVTEHTIVRWVFWFSVISLLYMILEIFYPHSFSGLVYGLYKREYRESLRLTFTSFFGTTYYSGFIYFTLYSVMLPYAIYTKKSRAVIGVVVLGLLVLLAQSKLMLLVLIIFSVFFFIIVAAPVWKICILLFISIFLVLLFYGDTLEVLLNNIPLTSASSLRTLLFSPNSSGTLLLRLEQIMFAFNEASFLGVGTGRDLALESWLASYFYRYGMLGVFAFIVFNLSLSLYAFYISRRLPALSLTKSKLFTSLGLWLLLIPISQLSSVMIDGSKFLFLYLIVVSVVLSPRFVKESVYAK